MEKQLPCNLESEQNVLGSILMGHDAALVQICDILKPEHFYQEANRQMYTAMLALFDRGQPIDYVSVTSELERQTGILPRVNIAELLESTPTPYHILYHAKEIIRLAGCRKGIILAGQMAASFYSKPDNLESLVGSLTTELLGIVDRTKRNSPSPKDILLELKGRDRSKTVYTSMKTLNRMAGGFEPTHLWIIGGFSSTGKTAFALQVLLDLLKEGRKSIYFSLEMSRHQLMLRLLGNVSGVEIWRIDRDDVSYEDRDDIAAAEDWLAGHDDMLWIYDDVYDLPEIGYLSRAHKMRGGLDVVFVDFIQNLRGGPNEYERLSDAAKVFQQLAKQLDCTVVLLSQISNEQAGMEMGTGQAYSFKGAGTIRDAADKAIMLKRDRQPGTRQEVGDLKVNLMKNRQGPIGELSVQFRFGTGRIYENA